MSLLGFPVDRQAQASFRLRVLAVLRWVVILIFLCGSLLVLPIQDVCMLLGVFLKIQATLLLTALPKQAMLSRLWLLSSFVLTLTLKLAPCLGCRLGPLMANVLLVQSLQNVGPISLCLVEVRSCSVSLGTC